jgi:RNA polymerase-binding transcription factor DksA
MHHEEFKTRLKADLLNITAELETIAILNPETGDWVATIDSTELGSADVNIVADVTEDWDTNQALLGQLETRYRNIVRALEKFDAGAYGICEISGETIEPERLAANPAARTNIANRDREAELPL